MSSIGMRSVEVEALSFSPKGISAPLQSLREESPASPAATPANPKKCRHAWAARHLKSYNPSSADDPGGGIFLEFPKGPGLCGR